MSKIHIFIFSSLMLVMTACKKESSGTHLPGGSVSIQTVGSLDTLAQPLSIRADSTVVIKLAAGLSGAVSSSIHFVDFAVDTTKMIAYQAKYGTALLFPSTSYFLYRSRVQLAAGSSVSDSAQINIVQESQLTGDTTYVLPVVITTVDGKVDGTAAEQTVYLVFRTGSPAMFPKTNWTIEDYSSENGSSTPQKVLDKDDLTTYWASNLTQQMPQYLTINFNGSITFSTVNYYIPAVLGYPAYGGYPTSIQIETSLDGMNWTNNGIYAGNLDNNMQSLNIGTTTAGYLRFTVLSSVKYAGAYSAIFISGIELLP